jgi:hypothetical protein
MDPSTNNECRSWERHKTPLEGGEEKRIHLMDTNTIVNKQLLHECWFMKYADIMNGVPPELPPLREINHRIPIIDEGKRYYYHLPCCPDAIKPQLMEKLRQYSDAGWWTPKAVSQAASLICIPKKMGKLRTVVDCCQQNNNTIKDVTPLPDQDQIWMDVT